MAGKILNKSHSNSIRSDLLRIENRSDKYSYGYIENKTGIDKSIISRFLTGQTQNPTLKTLLCLSEFVQKTNKLENNSKNLISGELIDGQKLIPSEEVEKAISLSDDQIHIVTETALHTHIFFYIVACASSNIRVSAKV